MEKHISSIASTAAKKNWKFFNAFELFLNEGEKWQFVFVQIEQNILVSIENLEIINQ